MLGWHVGSEALLPCPSWGQQWPLWCWVEAALLPESGLVCTLCQGLFSSGAVWVLLFWKIHLQLLLIPLHTDSFQPSNLSISLFPGKERSSGNSQSSYVPWKEIGLACVLHVVGWWGAQNAHLAFVELEGWVSCMQPPLSSHIKLYSSGSSEGQETVLAGKLETSFALS